MPKLWLSLTPPTSTWLSLLWVVACVILIIGLAYWFTKFVVGRGRLGGFGMSGGGEQFKVLARLNLGREQMLVMVQAGERCLLLGVTTASISTLAEFTPEEAQIWTKTQGQPAPPSFKEALHTILQQKRQR